MSMSNKCKVEDFFSKLYNKKYKRSTPSIGYATTVCEMVITFLYKFHR